MKKMTDKFNQMLNTYLTVFLPKQRGVSPHTILSAKRVWNMLLTNICADLGKRVEKLTFADFDRKAVIGFLDAKEKEKNWTPKTRNHRLGTIRSFFRYAADIEPTLAFHIESLKRIPLKKAQNRSHILEYMSQSAVTALLCQPDVSKKMGVRDTFFMSLMYDSAARDSELLSMAYRDFDPDGKKVYLMGKGNKPRWVSIDDNTVSQFRRYARMYHATGEDTRPLFYTIRHGKIGRMSDDNVARFIGKYSGEAKESFTGFPEKTTPHTLRRSRAMHMYQGGMPLEVIALILGHEDPQTTRVYAKADLEMKRRAMEKVKENGFDPERPCVDEKPIWADNEEIIRILCGLD